MDATGALSELGLTVPTSAEAIRRAYLRSVRAHPPERDPQGFRRVRDAYELLKDAPWLWTTLALREPGDDEDFDALVLRVEGSAAQSRDNGTTARIDQEPEAATPPKDEDVDEDADEDDDEDDDKSPEEEHFEHDLDEPSDPLERAMSSGDFERAADLLLEALGDERVGEELAFAPWQVIDVALRLYAQGKFTLGERLLAKFDGWVERSRLLPRTFGTVATARLALLKELRTLAGMFQASVVTALAASIEDGRFLSAAGALAKAFRVDDNFEFMFSRHAPLLYQAASRHASAWRKPRPAVRLRRLIEFPVWKFIALAIVLFLAARSPSPGEETVRTRLEQAATPSTARYADALGAWHTTTSADLDESVRKGDCKTIREKWHLFLATARSRTSEPEKRAIDERRTAVLRMCPELEGVLR